MGRQRQVYQPSILTPGELEVLRLAAEGLKNKDIAQALHFSEKTIEHMLGNADSDRAIYAKLGVKNRAQATGWYEKTMTAYQYLKDHTEDNLQWINEIRIDGQPRQAMARAGYIADRLRQEISDKFKLVKVKLLLKRLAQLLFEQLIAFYEIALPDQIWPFVDPRIKEIYDLAKECDNDKEIIGLADYGLGLAYYLTNEPNHSLQASSRAWQEMSRVDDKLKVLRTMALDWAYLQEEQNFRATASQAQDLIQAGKFSDLQFVGMTLEGLGRGQAILKLPTAVDTLEQGRQIYNQLTRPYHKMPIRQVQLIRSELEVALHLKAGNKLWSGERANEGLRLANEYGYPRYAEQIEQLVKSLSVKSDDRFVQ